MSSVHITIKDKKNCCGCNACHEACPKGCIEMRQDKMGCAYPHVNASNCISCSLCLRICPFIHPSAVLLPVESYAAVNQDEVQRLASSSGGVFIGLAHRIIKRGGVVFGAVFAKDWSVRHTYAETMEGVLPMMGSKYLQSDTRYTFGQAKRFLEDGRDVLYTGTPCQIAGLKHYLGKDYSNLLAVEVICHGTPAPGVWNAYLEELQAQPEGTHWKNKVSMALKESPVITAISFRDKRQGWKKYGFALINADESCYEPFTENRYMAAFLQNWSLRPSCYACKAKGGMSQADITIGDFWGIEKIATLEDDDKGTSCVICRTERGMEVMKELQDLSLSLVGYDVIRKGNPSLEESVPFTLSAKYFQWLFPRKGFFKTMNIIEHPSFFFRGAGFLWRQLIAFRGKGNNKNRNQ